MPITMCQGIVIGLDNESRTPTIPTLQGVVNNIDWDKSFVETSDINDINYVSEGFLSRYRYKLEEKPVPTWKKILTALAVIVVLAAAVVATVFTCGAAGVALGVGIAASVSVLGVTGVAGVAVATGLAAAAAVAVAAASFGIEAAVVKARQQRNKGAAQAVKGRYEEIPAGYERKETDESRKITHDLASRYIVKDPSKNKPDAVIVPEY